MYNPWIHLSILPIVHLFSNAYPNIHWGEAGYLVQVASLSQGLYTGTRRQTDSHSRSYFPVHITSRSFDCRRKAEHPGKMYYLCYVFACVGCFVCVSAVFLKKLWTNKHETLQWSAWWWRCQLSQNLMFRMSGINRTKVLLFVLSFCYILAGKVEWVGLILKKVLYLLIDFYFNQPWWTLPMKKKEVWNVIMVWAMTC